MSSIKKKVTYWSPHISQVATVKAVINSAKSLKKYSNSYFKPEIIDVFGEWEDINQKNSEIDFYKFRGLHFINKISSNGFFLSRIKYILIFIFSIYPLLRYLKNKKPNFLIIHLMTSLPLFLNIIFRFKTKIILRISGMPKLNFVRYMFWKISLTFIDKITFPTKETYENFKKLKITDDKKLFVLYDPILNTNEILKKKTKKNIDSKNEYGDYFLCIGRLTKQKNFHFLIECFKEISKFNNNFKVLILGNGEEEKVLTNLIKKYNLQNNIYLLGFKTNVFKYFKRAKGFILSSLWEDPGWVLVEAIYSNTAVISSDCPSGPKEIVGSNRGILFKNNSKKDFIEKFNYFESLDKKTILNMKMNAKKKIIQFTLLRHFKILKKYILV